MEKEKGDKIFENPLKRMFLFGDFVIFAARKHKSVWVMTTFALNNLWNYLQGLKLSKKDREWLADKLIETTADDAKTAKQKAYVKETLTRAFDEVERAKRGEIKLKTMDEFLKELEMEDAV